jgi:hypothetical protein
MLLKEKSWVLLSFIIIALLAYRNCFDVFIPGDNYSLFYLFEKEGLTGGIKNLGPYFVSLPVIFFLYKLLGLCTHCWISISIVLHILNAFILYLFTKQIANLFIKKQISQIAFFAGLLFLISPYQTEAILWNPTNLGFLLATSFSMQCLFLLVRFFEYTKNILLYVFHITYLLAVYSWEISFILPGISIVLYLVYFFGNKTTLSLKNFILKIFLPQIAVVLSYLITTKLMFGDWLWHSGAFEPPFSIIYAIRNLLKYFAKFFLFYRYLDLHQMDVFAKIIFKNYYLCGLLFFIVSVLFLCFFKKLLKNNKPIGYLLFGLFLCFIISLLPVLFLDSSFLSYIYPDRYGYMPSVFFYLFFVFTLFYLLKKIATPLLIIYCCLCWILLRQTTTAWSSANNYCRQLIKNYKPFLKYDRVYILNVPSYYKGIAAFRSAFAETIYMKYEKSPVDRIRIISGCYEESSCDSLLSVSRKQDTINVIGPKKQTPHFSNNGGWANSYETHEYSVKYDLSICSYILSFNQKIPKNTAFIYSVNGIWKKVD